MPVRWRKTRDGRSSRQGRSRRLGCWGTVLALTTLASQGLACPNITTVGVEVKEFIGQDDSLVELEDALVLAGRRKAVRQIATERVRGGSFEMVDDDRISFSSTTDSQFVGTVLSHEVVSAYVQPLGSREAYVLELRVDVCVEPQDQVWFVQFGEFRDGRGGLLESMPRQLAGLATPRIQFLMPGDRIAREASFTLEGEVLSESVQAVKRANTEEVAKYRQCRRGTEMTRKFFGGTLDNLFTASCGQPPRVRTWTDIVARATFQVRLCDLHLKDCIVSKEPHNIRFPNTDAKQWPHLAEAYYQDGFSFVGAIAVNALSLSMGGGER